MGKIAVHGHRGARARKPENTIAAFEYAINAGVDAIELDVVVTSDGVPVVAHDPVGRLTFAELRKRWPSIPTLPEVLALGALGEFLFNIELKPMNDAGWLAAEAVKLTAALAGRVLFQSFDFAILRELSELAPETPRGALFAAGFGSFAAIARRAEATFVSPEYHLVTKRRVTAAHRAGLPVITWTPNRPAEWRRLIEAGVDAIITDDPAALIEYLNGR